MGILCKIWESLDLNIESGESEATTEGRRTYCVQNASNPYTTASKEAADWEAGRDDEIEKQNLMQQW